MGKHSKTYRIGINMQELKTNTYPQRERKRERVRLKNQYRAKKRQKTKNCPIKRCFRETDKDWFKYSLLINILAYRQYFGISANIVRPCNNGNAANMLCRTFFWQIFCSVTQNFLIKKLYDHNYWIYMNLLMADPIKRHVRWRPARNPLNHLRSHMKMNFAECTKWKDPDHFLHLPVCWPIPSLITYMVCESA